MNTGCYEHPDRFALTTCAVCGRPLCAQCIRQNGRRALCEDDYAGNSGDVPVMIEPYRGPLGDSTPAIGLVEAPPVLAELKEAPAERQLATAPSLPDRPWRRPSDENYVLILLAFITRVPVFLAGVVTAYALYELVNNTVSKDAVRQTMLETLGAAVFGLLLGVLYLFLSKRAGPRRGDEGDALIVIATAAIIILICLLAMTLM